MPGIDADPYLVCGASGFLVISESIVGLLWVKVLGVRAGIQLNALNAQFLGEGYLRWIGI